MSAGVIELLILAGIAVFLLMRLRGVLGDRSGFEGGSESASIPHPAPRPERQATQVAAEGGVDADSETVAAGDADIAQTLAAMRRAEPEFLPSEFVGGSRHAFEMLLMAYETGERETLQRFMAPDLYKAFSDILDQRAADGLTVEARFIGVRDAKVVAARFDQTTGEAELGVRFVGELVTAVRDREGRIIEGDPNEIRRETATWTFARRMGADDPNWTLVATDE